MDDRRRLELLKAWLPPKPAASLCGEAAYFCMFVIVSVFVVLAKIENLFKLMFLLLWSCFYCYDDCCNYSYKYVYNANHYVNYSCCDYDY